LDVIGCNRLLHALAREGEGKRAVDFLTFMEERLGVPPDVVSYTSVMDACGKSGQWQEAVRLLERMEEEGEGWEGGGAPRPNLRTYTVGMQACAKAGKWQQCLALMDRLMAGGLKPDTFVCTIALDACARAKQPEAALTLLEKMEEGGMAVKPDVVSYTNVIRAFEGGRKAKVNVGGAVAVRHLLKRVKAWGMRPDMMLWNSALRVCVKLGQWQLTQEILKEMDQDGLAPDEWTVRAVASGGRVEGSAGRERGQTLALLREMQDRSEGKKTRGGGRGGGGRLSRMRGGV
jgi:pentatricopeptide repeat domain-containing protein 1